MNGPTLITGARGLLAPYLADASRAETDVVLTSLSGGSHRSDLRDSTSVAELLDDIRPGTVIHCAAMTDVDGCERDPEAADRINRGAVANLVNSLDDACDLIMISTDQVYPDVPGPHSEGAEGPINIYGRTKMAGEKAALRHPNALVLRANFFGPSRSEGRKSLSDWLIESLRREREITLFSDSLFSPLHLTTLTELVVVAARKQLRGVFNLGCRDGASKADFGLSVARHLGLQTQSASVGPAAAIPGRAPRPRDLRMAVDKIEASFGTAMPKLDEEIAKL